MENTKIIKQIENLQQEVSKNEDILLFVLCSQKLNDEGESSQCHNTVAFHGHIPFFMSNLLEVCRSDKDMAFSIVLTAKQVIEEGIL
jgi:hypothetical protein